MNGHIAKKGAKYYVVLELGVDPTTGRRRRKWHSGFDRKADAKAKLAELVDAGNKGLYVEPTRETFGDYLKRWLPTIQATVRPNTYESYRGAVEAI